MIEREYRLIRQAQKGKAEAFGLLYDRYCQQIYRFVFLKVNNKEEAEDLTQDVFLSAWQNVPNYDDRGFPFSSWLYRIARNKIIDHYRVKKENVSLEQAEKEILQAPAALENNLDSQAELNKLKKALSLLNEEQQTIIILRYIEEATPAEIAAILSKSEGAVRLAQHRAVKKLKIILDSNNI